MDDQGFDRSRRLLTPRDFKAVFDDATFKVSSRELLILARPNQLDCARLGLVAGKRHLKLAVQRNRFKRLTRESFRARQHELKGIDGIVLVRGGLDRLDNATVHQQLAQLWQQLQRKAAKHRAGRLPC